MDAIAVLVAKDIRLLLRDYAALFVTFVFPVVYCIFFGVIFATRNTPVSTVPLLFVNEDNSPLSRELLSRLESSGSVELLPAPERRPAETVRRGEAPAFLHIKAGFADAAAGDEDAAMGSGGQGRSSGSVVLVSDPSRPAEAGLVRARVVEALAGLLDQLGNHGGAPRRSASPTREAAADREVVRIGPFTLENEQADSIGLPANAYAFSFPQGIVWSVLGCTATFGLSIFQERLAGTLARLRAGPIGMARILAGKAGACFLSTILLAAALFGLAWLAFEVRIERIGLLALSLLAVATCFVGLMMLLSVLGRTHRSASGITWAVLLVMAMTGGGMVPRFYMPGWLQGVSDFSPVKWSILAMEGPVWRGFSGSDLVLPWGILVGTGVGCFLAGVTVFHLQRADQAS